MNARGTVESKEKSAIDLPPWTWPQPWRDLYEERAAIIQHDGKVEKGEVAPVI